MAGGPELVLEGLVKSYGEVRAVNGVSLEVRAGELVTLLGPSGSGKTTTLMMIAGFAYPTAGRVLFRGDDITYKPAHLRNIGMVFQNYALFPHMNVSRNVAFPLRMRQCPRAEIDERVNEALDLVHMSEYGHRMPGQLSGGQQQRVALARALVFEPSLLLMDEPLGALDRSLRERLQSEIKAIQEATGVTVVHVTHDQQEALGISDRVVVMDRGRVRMVGSARSVYQQPADAFVAQFVGETNLLRGRVVDGPAGPVALLGPGAEVPMPADAVAPSRETQQVTFCVRPERVRCVPARAGAADGLAARVVEVTYLGDVVKYRVALEGSADQSILAKQLAQPGGDDVRLGDAVAVQWQVSDVWVLSDGESHVPEDVA